MDQDEEAIKDRVKALEEMVSRLTEHCADLEWRLKMLSVVKIGEPRYALWDWVLSRGFTHAEHLRLMRVLSILDTRAEGEEIPDFMKKEIDGVPSVVLYSSEPLETKHVVDMIKRVLGIASDDQAMEILRAARTQGVYKNLTAFVAP